MAVVTQFCFEQEIKQTVCSIPTFNQDRAKALSPYIELSWGVRSETRFPMVSLISVEAAAEMR